MFQLEACLCSSCQCQYRFPPDLSYLFFIVTSFSSSDLEELYDLQAPSQWRWWVSVRVFSRIHPWHYQMSQVHGCHVMVSWHRTKNITTLNDWNLVETILCGERGLHYTARCRLFSDLIYFGRFVRSHKLVVKVKSIKCIKKVINIWNVCAKLNINSNQRLLPPSYQ